jgi:hypothetical protein
MNKFLKSFLRTAVCVMDAYSQQVDRASDRVSDLVDRGRTLAHPRQDQGLNNFLSFSVGVGIGVGAAILLAPASGKEIRSSIRQKVQNIGTRVS